MKTFKELKENLLIEKSMKIGDAKVDIKKVGKEFKVEIDGEHLDNYGSEKEAITMAKEFIKQYKG
jgi:hypothetical protein|tara:strand:- start:65 stop:259 length:195 start_codon:yes stop_codon:yes gene_type:complete